VKEEIEPKVGVEVGEIHAHGKGVVDIIDNQNFLQQG
jgi:hypothetical protein